MLYYYDQKTAHFQLSVYLTPKNKTECIHKNIFDETPKMFKITKMENLINFELISVLCNIP